MVKKRKSHVPPPPQGYPLSQGVRLIAGAWTAEVIWYLHQGDRCFTELHSDLAGVSPKVLTERLRRLERDGIIERHTRQTSPPTVWYSLTPGGIELSQALVQVADIARRLKPPGPAALPVIMKPEA